MQDAVICRRMRNFDIFLRLRKQPEFRDATGFPAKKRAQQFHTVMTRHYSGLGSASDWSCRA